MDTSDLTKARRKRAKRAQRKFHRQRPSASVWRLDSLAWVGWRHCNDAIIASLKEMGHGR